MPRTKPKPLDDDEKRQFIADFDSGKIKDQGSNRIRRDHYERDFAEKARIAEGHKEIVAFFTAPITPC